MISKSSHDIQVIDLPCGGAAIYDNNSGISYRCETCLAVVGSIAMPAHCQDLQDKWEILKLLGGEGWDYSPRSL
jgi:hypothetical protein